ncbi:MAG: hypothetical protein NC548_35570 [Lachnospiraceae bacterium]|nr:hypothetical protein [Lachnospiraceae bacterium]MCM1232710.1 hypothetical protein [Ruminococcus flavefaciens]
MKIIVELTNKENASSSWNDPAKLIKKYPYHAKSTYGGGFFENLDKIREFYSKFKNSEKINGCGEWEVE